MADERTLRRLERHIWELFGWRNRATMLLEPWTVSDRSGYPNHLNIGDRWDNLVLPVRMEVSLPADTAPDSLLELFVEGDALVFLDGELVGALSPFEREITVGAARGGQLPALAGGRGPDAEGRGGGGPGGPGDSS